MKRLTAILAALLLCFASGACTPQDTVPLTPPQEGQQTEQGQQPPSTPSEEETPPAEGDEDEDPTPPPAEGDENEDPTPPPDEEPVQGNAAYMAYAAQGYSALFADPYFTRGITLVDAQGNSTESLRFTGSLGTPAWKFAQWYTKYELSDYRSRSYTKGGAAFEYISKGARVNGEEIPAKVLAIDSTTAEIYMELNAQVEYDAPRQNGEGWPHTLLSQDFSGGLVQVCSLSSLVMDMDYTVTKFEDCMGDDADEGIHCAQLVWYITLQNRTRGSEDYGKYIWFGLNLWDNRNMGKPHGEYAAQDAGKEDATFAFIYQPPGEKYFASGKSPFVGERVEINFDVLSTAEHAFALAQSRGYLTNTTWQDIYIGGMNFGFEITGTYNAAVSIQTVGVYYKMLQEEESYEL